MLVLTRKLMEKLYIGEDICITVVRLEGGQVRLGIEAPRAVSVLRAELRPREGEPVAVGAGLESAAREPEAISSPRPEVRGSGIRHRVPSR